MKTLLLTLLISSPCFAVCPAGFACSVADIKNKEMVQTICSMYRNRKHAEDQIAYEEKGGDPNAIPSGPNEMLITQDKAFLKNGEKDFNDLKEIYKTNLGKDFDQKDCPRGPFGEIL